MCVRKFKNGLLGLLLLGLAACADENNYYLEPDTLGMSDSTTYFMDELMVKSKIIPEMFENNVFTSYLYMIPLLKDSMPESLNTYLTKDVFELSLRSPRTGAEIEIRVHENELCNPSVAKGVLPEEGQAMTIRPDMSWKYEALRKWDKTRILSVAWDIWIDHKLAGTYSSPFAFRSISECAFAFDLGNPGTEDSDTENMPFLIAPFFAGYVEEESNLIDELTTKALEQKLVDVFAIYQDDNDSILYRQIWSFWYLLQQQGVTYSNATDIPGIEYAQNVRFIEQAYNSKLANCVEGSVLFASLFTRIGLNCDLVLIPGHMYLMARDAEGEPLFGLETTLIGRVDLSEYGTEEEKRKASYANFEYAVKVGTMEFEEAKPHIEAGEFDYDLINIMDVRTHIPSINAGSDIMANSYTNNK